MNDDFNDFLRSPDKIVMLSSIKIKIEWVNTVISGSIFAFANSDKDVQLLSSEKIKSLKNQERENINKANPPITTAFSASSPYGFDNKGTKINSGKTSKNSNSL